MIEPTEEQILEAYKYAPINVIKVDIAHCNHKDAMEFKRDGNWLVLTVEQFQEWAKENLEQMDEGDTFIIQMDTMAEQDFKDLPEHTGW